MKKLLCVLMAVVMLLSSVAVFGASAAEGYASKNPITDRFDSAEEFAAENRDKKIYGHTYDFLCNKIGEPVDCTATGIAYADENGVTRVATAESLEAAYSDLSYYTKMIMVNFFGGEKLYTEESAVFLTNFFGKLVYPEFEEVTTVFGSTVTPNKDDFYKAIVEKSEIWKIVEANWINGFVDYSGFVDAMGGNSSSLTLSDSRKPKAVSKVLIEGVVGSLVALGPVEYVFNTLTALSSNYLTYYEAATALFKMKINYGKPVKDASGNVTERVSYGYDELRTVEGFLTYVFDGVLKYDFFTFPAARIVSATNDAVRVLSLLSYFTVNYNYKNNASAVNGIASRIFSFMETNDRRRQAGYNNSEYRTLKANVTHIIDTILKGEITNDAAIFIGGLSSANMDTVGDDILTQLKNWLSSLFRKIADYFDYIFKILSGEKKYGDDILDW